MADKSFPEHLCAMFRVRARDIRGIATSLLLWKNRSLASILSAACWRTPSVFADHYLQDILRCEGDVFALSTLLVAAGEVLA